MHVQTSISTEPNDARLLARVKLDFANCLKRGLIIIVCYM